MTLAQAVIETGPVLAIGQLGDEVVAVLADEGNGGRSYQRLQLWSETWNHQWERDWKRDRWIGVEAWAPRVTLQEAVEAANEWLDALEEEWENGPPGPTGDEEDDLEDEEEEEDE